MEHAAEPLGDQHSGHSQNRTGTLLLRASLVVVVLIGAILLVHLTPIRDFVADVPALREKIASMGAAIYPLSVLAIAMLVACGVPRLLLCGVAGAVFGFRIGMPTVLIATLIGHYGVFLFVRWGGREWVLHRWPKVSEWTGRVREHGIAGVILVRQLPAHAMLLNICLGLSHVRHRDFLIGTAIGILPEAIPATLIGAGLVKPSLHDSAVVIAIAVALIAVLWIVCATVWRRNNE